MSVHKKLQEARVKLQRTPLHKSGKNTYSGYSYFELGDFMPELQEIFYGIGLCGIVSFGTEIATLTIYDTEGEGTIQFTSPMSTAALKGCHEVQNLGAVQSYIRRYLWTTALEIVENDVLDATTGKEEPAKKKTETVVTTNVTPAVWGTQVQPAPIAQNLSTPVPNGTHAPSIQGSNKSWSLSVTVDPAIDQKAWIEAVNESLLATLVFADTEEDLKNIFRINKVIFDTYKSFDTAQYNELMDAFAARKAKLNAKKEGA